MACVISEKVKQEYIEFYDTLLLEDVKSLKSFYRDLFSNIPDNILSEIYATYLMKTSIKPSFVYFIYNKYTKLIKIGMSNDPIARLNTLNSIFKNQFGVNEALELLGVKFIPSSKKEIVEKMYHEKYKELREFGEWFRLEKDFVLKEILIGDLNIGFKIDYDTDSFLENEGFNEHISFLDVDEYTYNLFALDDLDKYTLKLSDNNRDASLFLKKIIADNLKDKYGIVESNNFFGIDVRNLDMPFSNVTKNKTWEMFKWLYNNKDRYCLSSYYKMNINTGEISKKVVGFNKDIEILDYFKLVECFVHDYFNITFIED